MSVERMWDGVKRGDGEIVKISWSYKDLKGTLPVGDMHMPYLRKLWLSGNRELKGEARGVGVKVVKFTDPCAAVLSLLSSSHISLFFLPSQVISAHSSSPQACRP
jgi:hypothetical protein